MTRRLLDEREVGIREEVNRHRDKQPRTTRVGVGEGQEKGSSSSRLPLAPPVGRAQQEANRQGTCKRGLQTSSPSISE